MRNRRGIRFCKYRIVGEQRRIRCDMMYFPNPRGFFTLWCSVCLFTSYDFMEVVFKFWKFFRTSFTIPSHDWMMWTSIQARLTVRWLHYKPLRENFPQLHRSPNETLRFVILQFVYEPELQSCPTLWYLQSPQHFSRHLTVFVRFLLSLSLSHCSLSSKNCLYLSAR